MSERDPERWLRSTSPEGAALKALLEAGRADRPSAAQLDALAERLEPMFSGPATGGGAMGGGGAVLAPIAIVGLVALGIAGVISGGRSTERSVEAKEHAVPSARIAPAAPPPQTVDRAARVKDPPVPGPQPPVINGPKPANRAQDATVELELLEQAHRELAASPERALQATIAHRQRFPHGVYEQEREVLAIEALLALEQHARAGARAERFLERHPDSSHARRVRALLAAAQSPPAPDTGTKAP